MSTDTIPHGTPSGYSHHGCRCQPCTDAQVKYSTWREYMILTGRWNPHIATDMVRAHILNLRAQGVPDRRTAELAGVGVTSIHYIVHRNGEKTTRRVGEAILSVTRDPDPPPGTKVPAWGTIRRCRALAALGWSSVDIADASGLTRSVVRHILRGRPRMVLSGTAVAVGVAFRELGGRFATVSRTSNQVRDHARAEGWPTPAGWEPGWLDLAPEELAVELNRLVDRMDPAERKRWWRAVRAGELSPVAAVAARRMNEKEGPEVGGAELEAV